MGVGRLKIYNLTASKIKIGWGSRKRHILKVGGGPNKVEKLGFR